MAETIDLTPQELDLKLYSGDGVHFRLVIKDSQDPPQSVNVSADSFKAQIRRKRGEDDPAEAEFTIGMDDSADGIIDISLTGEQTQALAMIKKFKGFWDVQWTPDGDQPRTFCQGEVECDVDVTR